MGEDDLEFTEEDMFSHLDKSSDDGEAGKENVANNVSTPEKPQPEKLKRQRSAAPDTHEIIAASSPDDLATRRRSQELDHPVSSHFRDAAGPSQSMTINRNREMMSRHRRSTDLDDSDRHISRLGTSMPITIPGMEKAMANKAASDRIDANQTGKFVPPHLLDQDVDSRAHSVTSGSLTSGSMAKRDRLLQRNKIFRRTGFLEGAEVEQGKAGSGALPELMDPLTRRLMPIKETIIEPSPRESFIEPSALSAALGTPRKNTLGQS